MACVKTHVKDPLLIVSIILGALGGLQAGLGVLTDAVKEYPVAFGLFITLISTITGGLTVYKNALAARASDPRTPLEHAAADHDGLDSSQ